MVTVILAFIFLTPRQIFKDSPTYHPPHPNEIVVKTDGPNTFIYEMAASAVPSGESDVQSALKRALEPLVGNIEITRYDTLRDSSGQVAGYRVLARRP